MRVGSCLAAVLATCLAGTAHAQDAGSAKPAPVVSAGQDGFTLRSADGAFALKLRGYLQLDGRFYLDDDERRATDSFVVRRARPIVEGTLWKIFDFRLMPDFGGGSSTLQDAYVEGRFHPALRLRAGKFKPPLSLERLQSATDIGFVERGTPSQLAPARDLGVQLGGELAGRRLEYQVGVFNGSVDGGSADSAAADGKELAGRVVWQPLRSADGAAPAIDFGIGVAASRGDAAGTVAAPGLPSFRTGGNQTFFTYRSDGTAAGTAIADGDHTRLIPQGWFHTGPFGALFERARGEQRVRRDTFDAQLRSEAWLAQASWVLTGERSGFRGVEPAHPWGQGGHGAWQLAVRYAELSVDRRAFPVFADPARAARQSRLVALALSWYPVRGVRWMLDAGLTVFDGGAANGADRADERALLTRFQISF